MLTVVVVAGGLWWLVRIAPRMLDDKRPALSITDLALSVVVAAAMWWTYWRAVDPSLATIDGLGRTHFVDAGGGTVTVGQYTRVMSIVIGIAVLFVFTGFQLCRRLQLFDVVVFAAADVGLFYFVGMAAFLSLFVPAARVTAHAFASAAVVLSLFAAASAVALLTGRLWLQFRASAARNRGRALALLPIIVAAMCLLQYVVTKRGGPMYDEFASYIATSNRLPLINRHFGQSALASVALMLTGPGIDRWSFPRVSVNVWLFVSQLAFLLLLYRVLRDFAVSVCGAVLGVAVLMLGNGALSLMPHVLYDHDYPFIMNIYTDSLFGIAGVLIMVMYLVRLSEDVPAVGRGSRPSFALVIPALFMIAFNYTAELDALVVMGVLGVLGGAALVGGSLKWPAVARVAAICAAALLVGGYGGGALSTRLFVYSDDSRSPFWERDSAGARMTISQAGWWYLPYLVPGFPTGFGNLPVPATLMAYPQSMDAKAVAAATISDSVNEKLIAMVRRETTGPMLFKYRNALYLAEMRLFGAIKALFFPLVGIIGLGVLLSTPAAAHTVPDRLRWVWLISTAAFTVGFVTVFFTNAANGNALFWKWALTRSFEPGLCLATVCLICFVDHMTRRVSSGRVRITVWFALMAVTSFATIFRILFYPSFNG